jgi:hypothetical protein
MLVMQSQTVTPAYPGAPIDVPKYVPVGMPRESAPVASAPTPVPTLIEARNARSGARLWGNPGAQQIPDAPTPTSGQESITQLQALNDELTKQYGTNMDAMRKDPRYVKVAQLAETHKAALPKANQAVWDQMAKARTR